MTTPTWSEIAERLVWLAYHRARGIRRRWRYWRIGRRQAKRAKRSTDVVAAARATVITAPAIVAPSKPSLTTTEIRNRDLSNVLKDLYRADGFQYPVHAVYCTTDPATNDVIFPDGSRVPRAVLMLSHGAHGVLVRQTPDTVTLANAANTLSGA